MAVFMLVKCFGDKGPKYLFYSSLVSMASTTVSSVAVLPARDVSPQAEGLCNLF